MFQRYVIMQLDTIPKGKEELSRLIRAERDRMWKARFTRIASVVIIAVSVAILMFPVNSATSQQRFNTYLPAMSRP